MKSISARCVYNFWIIVCDNCSDVSQMFISLYAAFMFLLNYNKFNTIEYYTMLTDLKNQNIWANAQLPRIRPCFSNFLHSADNRTIAHLCMIIYSRNSKILKGFKFLVFLVLQTFKTTKARSLSRSSLLFPPLPVPLNQQRVVVIFTPRSNLIQKKTIKDLRESFISC